MADALLGNFLLLFLVVDPIGIAPLYAALVGDLPAEIRQRTALKATLFSALILFTFALTGNALLALLKVEMAAFRIAGGVLLFLLAIDMVFARQSGLRSTTRSEQQEARGREDISVFPLAFPLIAGPGAMTTVLLMGGATGGSGGEFTLQTTPGNLLVLAAVLLLTYLCLRLAGNLMRLLGETGTNVISRVLGVILAALAVQYILDGLRTAL